MLIAVPWTQLVRRHFIVRNLLIFRLHFVLHPPLKFMHPGSWLEARGWQMKILGTIPDMSNWNRSFVLNQKLTFPISHDFQKSCLFSNSFLTTLEKSWSKEAVNWLLWKVLRQRRICNPWYQHFLVEGLKLKRPMQRKKKFYKTRQVYNGPRVVKFIRNQKIIFSKKWFLKKMIKNLINYA